ncbi:hypothetical protein NEMBOFW57_004012 [Staphylotrichum longicolle]|uniref:Uncharacterized protein n=1 Tax=Staphylotrichum longicolle TaxID=669026 RepID=A0AAD4F5Z8_9PEZI|nr:hypothetical protein NEMBOFW57_004012 [Staphylotrichum longicolle]
MSGQKDSMTAEGIENVAQRATSNFTMAEKISDGDDALQFLQQGQEAYDKQEEKRVLRKIDFRMTLSYAGTYGLATQANLVGQEFSLLVTIFYLGYLVAQYPANLLMQKYPTGKFITISFCLWAARMGTPPTASLAHQPVIFWAIAHIDARGLYPYQWMFFISGVATVLFGASLWWLLPDSPMTAGFLSPRERFIAVDRLKSNKTGIKNSTIKKPQLIETVRDVRVWLLLLGVFCHNMTNSLQTTFTGIIIKGFGYSTYDAQWGQGKRLFTIIVLYLPGIVSTSMSTPLPSPRTQRPRSSLPCTSSAASRLGGHHVQPALQQHCGVLQEVLTGAMFFGSYCVSNIVSPQVFLARESPRYPTGIAVCLAMYGINILVFSLLYVLYSRDNKQRDANDGGGEVDEDMELVNGFADMTDRQNQSLRYKL